MLLTFHQHIPVPILRGCRPLPQVRRHAVKNRTRGGKSRCHCLSVTLVEGMDVLVYRRQRIGRSHFKSPVLSSRSNGREFPGSVHTAGKGRPVKGSQVSGAPDREPKKQTTGP